jgi:hypothetical protein
MFDELNDFKKTSSGSYQKIEYNEVLNYALDGALEALTYYDGAGANSIINDDTFSFLWESCPEKRDKLLGVILSKAENSNFNYRGALTYDYCLCWAKQFYDYLSAQEELSKDAFRAKMRLTPVVDRTYDYLAALSDAELRQNADASDSIKRAGLENSVDSNFFDYCFSKVKRAPGSVNEKSHILNAAAERGALSDSLVKAIAKSSPISLKRQVAAHLSDVVSSNRRRSKHRISDEERELYENKVVHAESLIMLFASTADYKVIASLADCISKDNFPWIMPAVSSINHYWLTKKVERAIEAE